MAMAILQRVEPDRNKRKERLEILLDELKIKHIRKSKGYSLSGGERRRVEITRSLVTNPDFILLDEPFAFQDKESIERLREAFTDLNRENTTTLVIVAHDRSTMAGWKSTVIEIAESPVVIEEAVP